MAAAMAISLKDAATRIRAGELVAFPTETVYGLGANALDATAVEKIYAAKGRPATSPSIVHAASVHMASALVRQWPPEAEALAQAYWPGPLTLVLPKKTSPKESSVPDIVTAGLPTVGVRMPDHPLALALIREAGLPIAAPSANRFTGLSPTTAEHVHEIFGDAIPVLDGGPCRVGIESTVVSITAGKITLLRPGHVSLKAIAETTGRPVEEIELAAAPRWLCAQCARNARAPLQSSYITGADARTRPKRWILVSHSTKNGGTRDTNAGRS